MRSKPIFFLVHQKFSISPIPINIVILMFLIAVILTVWDSTFQVYSSKMNNKNEPFLFLTPFLS